MSSALIILLITALLFDFLNGFHDSSNIVATPIASRALSPRKILWLAAIAEFAGPFIFGVAVAETIGTGLTDPQNVTMPVVIAAMLAAVIWNIVTWWLGIPSSSSHALVGGVIGAVTVGEGIDAIQGAGLIKVSIALFLSPVLGILFGYLLMNLTLFLARGATPRINGFFRRAQLVTAVGLALSHGANDAQKTMGIITLGLLVNGTIDQFVVPTWVIALSAGMIALGTATGGWRLIRTLGGRIYKIRPVHGFVSQMAGASIILGAALFGGPVSTTQVMSSSIMGAGTAERLSKVRWQVGSEMLVAWVLTIPISAIVAAIVYFPLNWLLGG
ncbi:MAG: inorganic phosphate transporter [Ardenticatenaceae bacterium]|nr:inorganic phosphate transporter [Ardenticatenaceae bacterium]MCB9443272.1 inorganic phosphate transporter [Ardenticatenaceae bacterium]